jgi:hypothetical protein
VSAINNGGLAFPRTGYECTNGDWVQPQLGMTLRDWFAGQALAGVLKSCGDLSCYYDHLAGSKGDNYIPSPAAVALFAYELADAMIEAREVKP